MNIFRAAYCLRNVYPQLINHWGKQVTDEWFATNAAFEVTAFTPKKKIENNSPLLIVLQNILFRGLPSFVSKYIENIFEEAQITDISADFDFAEALSFRHTKELQLLYTPIAVAHIQKVIIEAVFRGCLNLKDSYWEIVVVEHDVPCAAIAFEDLKIWYTHLQALQGVPTHFPEIKLTIVGDEYFRDSPLHNNHPLTPAQELPIDKVYDFMIDIAVYKRNHIRSYPIQYACRATVRPTTQVEKEFLNTTPSIKYTSVLTDKSAQHSLLFLAQNILNMPSLTEGHIKFLNALLQGNPAVGVFTTQEKHICIRLAAFLQPGLTWIIVPDGYELKKEVEEWRSFHVQVSATDLKGKEYEDIENYNTLVRVVLANDFRKKKFRQYLQKLIQREYYTAQCFLTEAHSVSEWSYDLRIEYVGLAKTIKNIFDKSQSITIGAITPSHHFNTLKDIQAEIGQEQNDDAIIRDFVYGRFLPDFKVITIEDVEEDTSLIPQSVERKWSFIKQVKEQKNRQLEEILQNRYEEIGIIYDDEKNLTSTPKPYRAQFSVHVNTPQSLEQLYAQTVGVAQAYILFSAEPMPIIRYGTGLYEVNTDEQTLVENYRRSFKSIVKEKTILRELLTRITFPSSLRLENNFTKKVKEKFGVDIRMFFWQSTNTRQKRLYIKDKDNKYSFGYIDLNEFKDYEDKKEVNNHPLSTEIRVFVKEMISARTFQRNNLTDWLLNYFKPLPQDGIEKILKNVLYSDEDFTINVNYINDIDDKSDKIITLLDSDNLIEKLEIILNDDSPMGINMDEDILNRAVQFASRRTYRADEFIETINDFYKIELRNKDIKKNLFYKKYNIRIQLPANQAKRKEIEDILLEMRHREDTQKAILRLSTLGIVDDFWMDDLTKEYTLSFRRYRDEFYTRNLYDYMRRHISDMEADNLFSHINKVAINETLIQKCLDCLLEFSYKYIAEQRSFDSDKVNKVCLKSLETGNGSIRYYMEQNFNYKYLTNLYKPTLLDETKGELANIDVLWKYMDIVAQDPQDKSTTFNFYHLRNSCKKLQERFEVQPILPLLYGFTGVLIESFVDKTEKQNQFLIRNKARFDESIEHILNGFVALKKSYRIEPEEFNKIINIYLDKLIYYRPAFETLRNVWATQIHLETHRQWLKNFNTIFLKNYDRE